MIKYLLWLQGLLLLLQALLIAYFWLSHFHLL